MTNVETTPPALFVPLPGGARATELTRGPWAHQVMHGGAICGLLGWAVERQQQRHGIAQVCSRLTVEILSGMPMASYDVTARTVKAGRRTALIDAEVRTAATTAAGLAADGVADRHAGPNGGVATDAAAPAAADGAATGGRLVARATSQWLTPTLPAAEPADNGQALPPIPAERADPGANPDIDYPRPGFNADAVDLRFVGGSTEEPGPGRTWLRLEHPLMAGEPPSPLAQIATLADLGAAIGWDYSPTGGAYINTDVTLQAPACSRGRVVLLRRGNHRHVTGTGRHAHGDLRPARPARLGPAEPSGGPSRDRLPRRHERRPPDKQPLAGLCLMIAGEPACV